MWKQLRYGQQKQNVAFREQIFEKLHWPYQSWKKKNKYLRIILQTSTFTGYFTDFNLRGLFSWHFLVLISLSSLHKFT